MKYVIDRTKWYRGKGATLSALLRSDGTMCCLGQVGLQCGIKPSAMLYVGGPHSAEGTWPQWILDNSAGGNIPDNEHAMSVNDSEDITDAVREAMLKAIFARHGDELEFIN